MGKVVPKKKTVVATPEPTKIKTPKPKVQQKRKKAAAPRTRIVSKPKLRPYLNALCAAKGVPKIHTDALEIVENSYAYCHDRILKNCGMVLSSKRDRMLTRKTVDSAFLAYMEQCGVADVIKSDGLQVAHNAIKALE